jgi:hypothetical protein
MKGKKGFFGMPKIKRKKKRRKTYTHNLKAFGCRARMLLCDDM